MVFVGAGCPSDHGVELLRSLVSLMLDLTSALTRWFAEGLASAEFVPFGSQPWWRFTGLILAGRAFDLGSTFLATPRLRLEGNPIARRLGWRGGILLSVLMALIFGGWPLIAISLTTTSALVAARNFQHAWIMRSMGEAGYQSWFSERVWESPVWLVMGCHWAEALMAGLPGVSLLIWGEDTRVSLGIGLGLTAYGGAVAGFSTWVLSHLWRDRLRYQRSDRVD